ncbi:MAG: hypothetical protein ACREEB_18055 [Caulobacteraceae bacterium]
MRKTLILAAIAALALTSAANAKSCKDANGKFITCPSAAAAQTGANAMAAARTKSAKATKSARQTSATTMKAARRKSAKARESARATSTTAMAGAGDTAATASAGAAKKDAAIARSANKRANSDQSKAMKAAPRCAKGKPCGKGCIPTDKVCHK